MSDDAQSRWKVGDEICVKDPWGRLGIITIVSVNNGWVEPSAGYQLVLVDGKWVEKIPFTWDKLLL